MIRVGLTGTLGAGKSTVGRLFESWGAWRIDADELARVAVEPGRPALRRIRSEFGETALLADGTLHRAALRRLVFRDPDARRRLEAIIHPEVGRLRREELERAREAGVRVVVEEVPLLFEVGMEGEYDAIVVVDAPPAQRRRRLEGSRALDPEEFDRMESSQLPAAQKRARADHVIENDGSQEELTTRAGAVWKALGGSDPART